MGFLKSNQKRGLSILRWLYFITSLAIFGSVLILVWINLIWLPPFLDRIVNQAINYQLVQAKRAAEYIEKSIQGEMKDIQNLSQDLVIAKNQTFFINRFLKDNPAIKEVSLIDLNGKEQSRYSRLEFFTKKDLRDFEFIQEFEQAKKGKTWQSEVRFTEKAEPYIIITTPLRENINQKPKGVLRVVFYLKGMWERMLEISVGQTGRISVIDDKGMLIADPDPSRVLKKVNLLELPPTKSLILGKEFEGEEYLNEKGIPVIGVGAPLKKLRWGVIVEQAVSEIEYSANSIRKVANLYLVSEIIVILLLIGLLTMLRIADRELLNREMTIQAKTQALEEEKASLEIKVRARTRQLAEQAEALRKENEEKTRSLRERLLELEKFQRLTVGRELKMVELKKEIKRLKKELEKYGRKK